MALQQRLRFIWRYLTGNLPWDSGIVPPEIVAWVERNGTAPGRALDLGCGPGTTVIYLARLGWDALGVDFAPNAIALARRRARRAARRAPLAGSLAFLSADVSRPDLLRDAAPFDLVIDVGCLHSVPEDRRADYAANVTRLARPGAGFLLYAFRPLVTDSGRRIGIDHATVRALFAPAFEIESVTEGEEVTSPRPSAWTMLKRAEVSQ